MWSTERIGVNVQATPLHSTSGAEMPNQGAMAQLSRPYQVGLLAVVLLAAAWLLLIQGHTTSPSTPAASSPVPAATSTAQTSSSPASKAGGSASHIYHGAAPGVEGLTKDIAKAKGAVETSQQNAKQLAEKSAQASNEPTHSAVTPAPTVTKAKSVPTTHTKAVAPVKTTTKPASPAPSQAKSGTPSAQQAVEAELAKGKIVLILFWNPKGADDQVVHKAVDQLQHNGRLGIAVHQASASEVASFGTVTKGVQVYGTPTLLVINKQGKALTLTGLQEAFTIEQAIQEAKRA
jgi:hypothetical protein